MSALELGQAIALTQAESRRAAVAELDASKRVAILPIPDDPLRRYYIVKSDGTLTDPILPPAHHLNVVAGSLEEFAAVARLYGCQAVLVGTSQVKGLPKPSDERDCVFLPLDEHPEAAIVRAWRKRTAISQEDLVRVLRLELGACVADDSAQQLLKFAEGFKVSTAGVQQQTIKRERESLGRSIDAEVQSDAGNCPDSVSLYVRLHRDVSLQTQHKIKVRVDFSPSSSQFFLLADESEFQQAVERQVSTAMSIIAKSWASLHEDVFVPPIVAAQ